MSSFDDLKRKREEAERKAKEEQLRKERNETRHPTNDWNEMVEARDASWKQYRPLVTEVLRDLREAVYPDGQLDSRGLYSVEIQTKQWHEVRMEQGSTMSEKDWSDVIRVTLEFDSQSRPTHFLCINSRNKEEKAGLSREDLARTLRKLLR